MRKLIVTALLAFAGYAAYGQQGQSSVGISINYGTEIESVGFGINYNYGITDAVRLSPNFTYFVKKDHVSMWDINLDVKYLFYMGGNFKIYPIGGLSVASAKVHDFDFCAWDDCVTLGGSTTKFGVNLGGGVEWDVSATWALNLDIKYRIMSTIDQAIVGVGFAYRF